MKIQRGKLLSLWYTLEGFQNQKKDVKFSYFIAKNKISIKGEIDAITAAQEPSEKFKDFDNQRGTLAKEMADRVPGTDDPIIEGNQYKIEINKIKFERQLTKLRTKFQTAITEREKQIEAFNTLLTEEIEFEGYPIELGSLPNQIEPSVMEVLIEAELIKE